MSGRLEGNDEIVHRCFDDTAFRKIVHDGLAQSIYEAVLNRPRTSSSQPAG